MKSAIGLVAVAAVGLACGTAAADEAAGSNRTQTPPAEAATAARRDEAAPVGATAAAPVGEAEVAAVRSGGTPPAGAASAPAAGSGGGEAGEARAASSGPAEAEDKRKETHPRPPRLDLNFAHAQRALASRLHPRRPLSLYAPPEHPLVTRHECGLLVERNVGP